MGEREDNEIPKGPEWLTSPGWWFGLLAFAIGVVAVRYVMNGGQFS